MRDERERMCLDEQTLTPTYTTCDAFAPVFCRLYQNQTDDEPGTVGETIIHI